MIRKIKLWQMIVLFLVLLGSSVLLLRQNSLSMIRLRDAVKVADEKNGDVQGALTALQRYVTGHMNANMGDKGIYLDKTYQRAYERALQATAQNGSQTSPVYRQADQVCRGVFLASYSFQAYVQCVADQAAASGAANDPVAAFKPPSTDLYRHNFVSPQWSPDLAGFVVILTFIVLMLIFARVFLAWLLHLLLRYRRGAL
jgi:preprotein translocase subunit SecF